MIVWRWDEPVMDAALHIQLPFKEFLQNEACPADWRRLDLYILRDDEVVFYVGQSYVAFHRVWEHFYGGFKGRSIVGRFIVCNWPTAMNFTIELLSSRAPRFEDAGFDRFRAEQMLIELHQPCLNTALNPCPVPVPGCYRSPYTALKYSHHPRKFIQQAAQAIQAEQRKTWFAEDQSW